MTAGGDAGDREITLDELRDMFPGWQVFRGGGAWWAVDQGPRPPRGQDCLVLRALTGPALAVLADRLCLQAWLDDLDAEAFAALDGLDADGLAAAYQSTFAEPS
jgi:hypothetical protein